MRYLLILAFLLPLGLATGQEDYPFEEAERSTVTYFQKPGEDLKVDIFQPKGDDATGRPLLLYVHGGGFATGERDHPNHLRFCEQLARRGLVSATMSYTLVMKGKSFGCDRPAPEKIQTFLHTARDIARATRFFIDQAVRYGIDTSKIIILGSSAGAEAVLHAAYWKATYKDENGPILAPDFQYAGVVSMAGAITNLDWITRESAIPTFLFHGTCDNLVPYGSAPHHYCAAEDPGYLVLHGAYSIAEKLRALGKPYVLVTGCNGRHEWNDKPLREMEPTIARYIDRSLNGEADFQVHEMYGSEQAPCPDYNTFNFCTDR
ncbi:MAG: alpha/beta hydrolase fold domain-containing protein [Bacteroidetes bacterium]|jgi:acetyl esterase/lipase|nr:alpha/beta hydrolase fold domain-containing protein [Bacteroidota bacterium]